VYLEELYSRLSSGTAYFPIILKSLGIAYITEFTSAICKDAGEKSIAGKVELAGKIAIFFVALPVFTSLLDLLNGLLP
jgi:stage III sporulation protein AD